jgi:hypothetical protein
MVKTVYTWTGHPQSVVDKWLEQRAKVDARVKYASISRDIGIIPRIYCIRKNIHFNSGLLQGSNSVAGPLVSQIKPCKPLLSFSFCFHGFVLSVLY